MWLLDNKNKSIQAKISDFISIELDYFVMVENRDINNKITLQGYEGKLNGTYKDIVPAPASNITKEIKNINIRNNDTNAQTIQIILNDITNNIDIILFTCLLETNDSLIYNSQTGWAIYNEQGLKKNDTIQFIDYLIIVDTDDDPITYIGYALPGTNTSDNTWKIKRLDTTSGVIVKWANGQTLFNNIWDDRASLTYS